MSTPAKRIARRLKVVGFAGLALAFVAAMFAFGQPFGDSDTRVPAPVTEMTDATVAQLAKARAAQGVCYGWHLLNGQSTVSRASNLGAGTAVDSDPSRCPKWVEVRASVRWTPSSSEAPDSAFVTIRAGGVGAPDERALDRFGLSDKVFIDEPDAAICQAALALPLLLAETGAVAPAPAPSGAVASAPASSGVAAVPGTLPSAGSDFWRDRWLFIVGGALLFLFAGLAIAVGWFERKHERSRPMASARRPPPAKAAVRK